MKITFLCIGKTAEPWLLEGIDVYTKRLKHYIPFSIEEAPLPRKLSKLDSEQQKVMEGEAILSRIAPTDDVYLLDERGAGYSSEELSAFLQKKMLTSVKHLVFIAGGPFGFSETVYRRANGRISLSRMTFSHQMIRLLFCEQVYRAFTIIRGEPYHHA